MSPRPILLFPHGHTDLLVAVRDLNVRSKTQPPLRVFLSAASTAVRERLSLLNGSERSRIGEFEDIVDLAERYATQDSSNVIEMILSTSVQIGQLILYVTYEWSYPLSRD